MSRASAVRGEAVNERWERRTQPGEGAVTQREGRRRE